MTGCVIEETHLLFEEIHFQDFQALPGERDVLGDPFCIGMYQNDSKSQRNASIGSWGRRHLGSMCGFYCHVNVT